MSLLQDKESAWRSLLSLLWATLFVVAGGASGAALAQSEGIGIRPPPAATSEGAAAVFVVTLPGDAAGVVSVTYTVRATPSGGVSIADFASPTSTAVARAGALPFSGRLEVDTAVTRTGFIVVSIYDDDDSERAESFIVDLGGGVSATATIAASDPIEISGFILDGDLANALEEISEFSFFVELDSGQTTAASTLTLAWEITADPPGPPGSPGPQGARGVEVADFAASENIGAARVGAFPITGTIVIPAGGANGAFYVPIFDDDEVEPLEFFRVALVGVIAGDDDGAYYKIGAPGTALAYVAASDREVGVEGPGTGVAVEGEHLDFTFALSEASAAVFDALTVHFVITGTGVSADDFEDARGNPLATLPTTAAIAVNETSTTLTLRLRADGRAEGTERFRVRVRRVSGGGLHTNHVSAASSASRVVAIADVVALGVAGALVASEGGALVFPVRLDSGATAAASTLTLTWEIATASDALRINVAGAHGDDLALAGDAGAPRGGAFPVRGTSVIASGSAVGVIVVPVFDDALVEPWEVLALRLTGVAQGRGDTARYRISDALASAPGYILPSDREIGVERRTPAAADEGGSFDFAFFVSEATADLGHDVTVHFVITGSGVAADDFEDQAGNPLASLPTSAVIIAGSRVAGLRLRARRDGAPEGDEQFAVRIERVTGGGAHTNNVLAAAAATSATINDRNRPLRITPPTPVDANEGQDAVFVVALPDGAVGVVAVTYTVAAAAAGGVQIEDFADAADPGVARAGALPFEGVLMVDAAATRTGVVTIPLYDDAVSELAEAFTVTLHNGASATATIRASDPIALVIGEDEHVAEGGEFTFVVYLGGVVAASTLTLVWEITGGEDDAQGARGIEVGDLAAPGDGATARAGGFPVTGTLVIPAGRSLVDFVVATFDDEQVEPLESLRVAVAGDDDIAYYETSLTSAAAYIFESDREISVRAPRIAGADEGGYLDFTFALSEASAGLFADLTLHIEISGTGITAGDFADDFGDPLAVLPTTAVIRAGARAATLRLRPRADGEIEGAEEFRVRLRRATGGGGSETNHVAAAASSASAMINAEAPWALTPASQRVDEGAAATFIVTAPDAAVGVVAVTWTVAAAGARGAQAEDFADPADPGAPRPGVLPFSGMVTVDTAVTRSAVITLPIYDDDVSERPESFTVTLQNGARATAVINANDPVTLSITRDVSQEEGTTLSFVLSSSRPAASDLSVRWEVTADVPATQDTNAVEIGDFPDATSAAVARRGGCLLDRDSCPAGLRLSGFPLRGVAVVAARATTGGISIPTFDDDEFEPRETFRIVLTGVEAAPADDAYYVVGTQSAFGRIERSEREVRIRTPRPAAAAAGGRLVFPFALSSGSAALSEDMTIHFTLSGTVAAQDFTDEAGAPLAALPTTAIIAAGRTDGALVLRVRAVRREAARFRVTLRAATGGGGTHVNRIAAAASSASATINASVPLALAPASQRVDEGATATFTVTAADAATGVVAVIYTVAATGARGVQAIDFADPANPGAPRPGALPFTGMVTVDTAATRNAVIALPIYDDDVSENTEAFVVTLGNGVSASATIAANDPIGVSVEAGTVAEESGEALSWRIRVGDGATAVASTLTVHWKITAAAGAAGANAAAIGDLADPDDAAVARGGDFPIIGQAVVAPRTATGAVAVRVFDDTEFEPREALRIVLTGVTGGGDDPAHYGVGTQSAAFGYIVSGDREITLRAVRPAAVAEGGSLAFVLALSDGSAALTQALTARVAITGAGITAGDFEDAFGNPLAALHATATISAGRTTGAFTLRVRDDDDAEEAERFQVVLRNVAGGGGPYANNPSAVPASAVIGAGDRRMRMAPQPVAVAEGSSAVFTVLLPDAATGTFDISYAVSAAPGAAGVSLSQFYDEFRVSPACPEGCRINRRRRGPSAATGISIEDFASTTSAAVARTGNLPFSGMITVDADAAASGAIHVPITDDDEFEPRSREVFQVALTAVVDGDGRSHAIGVPSSGVGVIINDDGSRIRSVSVDRARVLEGESIRFSFGFQNQISVPFTLVRVPDILGYTPQYPTFIPRYVDEFLHYQITGTGITAADFARNEAGEPLTSLRGSLRVSRVTGRFDLWTNIDGEREGAETFRFIATAITDGSLPLPGETLPGDSSRVAVIQPQPATITPPVIAVAEGESAALSVAAATTARTEIRYKVAAAAVGGVRRQDFQIVGKEFPLPPGFFDRLPLTYRTATNEGRGAIRFRAVDDAVSEREESFIVFLSESSASVTIGASDPVEIALDAEIAGREGDVFFFPITASAVAASTLTVTWAITAAVAVDGAAAAAARDFADATDSASRHRGFPVTGSAVINAGTSAGVVTVATFQDDDVEPRESFRVVLTGVQGGRGYHRIGARNSALGHILPSDREVGVEGARAADAHEGQSLSFVFAVSSESVPVSEEMTVHFVISGTGVTPADFADEAGNPLSALPTTALIAASHTAGALTLRLRVDGEVEEPEEFRVLLERATGGGGAHANQVSAAASSAAVTILPALPIVDPIVGARVYLQGAYAGSGGMSTGLIDVLPRRQPYNVAPWNYPATTTVPHVGEGSGLSGVTSTIVDWVLVELRTGANVGAILESAPTPGGRATGLLLRDGRIAGINEDAATAADALFLDGVRFETELPEGGQVYVLVHHRNHLSVISANALAPGSEGCTAGYCVDFRFAQSHGGRQAEVGQGTYAMFAGDVDRNGVIDERDETLIRVHNLRSLGAGAYRDPDAAGNYAVDADLDFDGEVLSADRCFVLAPGNQGRCRTFSAP